MSKKCGKCNKSVYHNDPQLPLGGKLYHKVCARCAVCNGYLSIKNFTTSGERLLCKVHFKEEFSMGGGKYAGDEKFKHSLSGSLSGRSKDDEDEVKEADNDSGTIPAPVPEETHEEEEVPPAEEAASPAEEEEEKPAADT